MADNYLEKRQQELAEKRPQKKKKDDFKSHPSCAKSESN